ncbi:hypothetical protein DYB32_003142 [Aphanomyces invadans]|uniref:Mitochondrial carrier n=1 Tax=Aphanomyces invadans TaxID=157072 RepID=A0A418B1A6_9STRA|nr:hypothetical protein DYB32_003142 [Aphanomyces invadans]
MATSAEPPKPARGLLGNFIIAAAATSLATIGSNPMEVVKTRMQLQGELASKGAPIVYRNSIHAFYTICRLEGIAGIQRGLVAGMCYQQVFGATDPNHFSFPLRNMAAGATSGAVGAMMGSPFFLVKARLQAQSTAATINAQYHYRGTVRLPLPLIRFSSNHVMGQLDAIRQIVAKDGVLGLYRGVNGAIPRVAVGSAAQLSTYASSKHLVLSTGLVEDGVWCHLAASLVTGLAVTTAMNPFDVVSTRLYSQKVVDGKGVLYSGVLDCFKKTFGVEGVRGLFKGWSAHYLRLGPHTILTFVFWEQAKSLAASFGY